MLPKKILVCCVLVAIGGSLVTADCNLGAAAQCANSNFGGINEVFTQAANSAGVTARTAFIACNSYRQYQSCVAPHIDNCSTTQRFFHDAITGAFSYACSQQAIADFLSTSSCWNQPSVVLHLQECQKNSSFSSICTYTADYTSCVLGGVTHCTPQAVAWLQKLLKAAFDALEDEIESLPMCSDDDNSTEITTTVSTTQKPIASTASVPVTSPSPVPVTSTPSQTSTPLQTSAESVTSNAPTTTVTTESSTQVPPARCDIVASYACVNNFTSAESLQIQMMSDAFKNGQLNISYLVSICREFEANIKSCILPEIGGCSQSDRVGPDTLIAVFDYVCSARGGLDIAESATCLAKSEVVLAIQDCNTKIPRSTDDVCSLADQYQACVQAAVRTSCTPAAELATTNLLVHSMKPIRDVFSCNMTLPSSSPVPMTSSSVPATTTAQTTTSTDGNTPVRCNIAQSYVCLADFSKTLQRNQVDMLVEAVKTGQLNISHLAAMCRDYEFAYKPCVLPTISGCSKTKKIAHDTMIAAFDYICNPGGAQALFQSISCWGKPEVLLAIQGCNVQIALGVPGGDVCSIPENYQSCVQAAVTASCSSTAQTTIRNMFLQVFKPFREAFSCRVRSTTFSPFPTSTAAPPSSTTQGFYEKCNLACLNLITDSANAIVSKIPRGTFVLSDYLNVCPDFGVYRKCITPKLAECPDITTVQHKAILDVFGYICVDGLTDIVMANDCWVKNESMALFQHCSNQFGKSHPIGLTCRMQDLFEECLIGGFQQICDASAVNVVKNFVIKSTQAIREAINCSKPGETSPTFSPLPTTFSTMMTSTAGLPSTTPPTSSTEGVYAKCDRACFNFITNATNAVVSRIPSGTFTLSDYVSVCPDFGIYKACISPRLAECPASRMGTHRLILDLFEYVCEDGLSDIVSTDDCWMKNESKALFKHCFDQHINRSPARRDTCRIQDEFEECAVGGFKQICDASAVNVVKTFLFKSSKGIREALNCSKTSTMTSTKTTPKTTASTSAPATTTTATTPTATGPLQLPLDCYDCNSGMPKWRNRDCPINGQLSTNVPITSCNGACFSRTVKWNEGVIFRGCAAHFYFSRPIPRAGCVSFIRGNHKDETWCFCDRKRCNVQPMGQHLDEKYRDD